jgi:hypothetical protein
MLKYLFALIFISSVANAESIFSHKSTTRQIRSEFRHGNKSEIANRGDIALDSIVRFAIWKLRNEGFYEKANKKEGEWETRYKGTLSRFVRGVVEDIGDHAPLSQWLSDLYNELETLFGPEVMHYTHLEDIKTFNYTIPVVFNMQNILNDPNIDEPEYAKHFVPFTGVTTYWSVWIVCEVVTYSSGWFVICTPAATAGEYVMENYIAPHYSQKAYDLFWN